MSSDTPIEAGQNVSSFTISWDYRCPFARNAHDHLVTALQAGAPFDVTFLAYSLSQGHLAEGETSVWDEPEKDSGMLAMLVGIVVRDKLPEQFLAVHRGLFELRHADAGDLRDAKLIRQVLDRNGVDADFVFNEIDTGWPLETFHKEHELGVNNYSEWGVPTFIANGQAVFVRLMNRADGDAELARRTIERIVDLIENAPEINEYKHTSLPR